MSDSMGRTYTTRFGCRRAAEGCLCDVFLLVTLHMTLRVHVSFGVAVGAWQGRDHRGNVALQLGLGWRSPDLGLG